MSDDEVTLLAIKGMIAELEPKDRREFEALTKQIRLMVKKAGNLGTLAVALLGAELQLQDGSE
jgi:hypothetical protein